MSLPLILLQPSKPSALQPECNHKCHTRPTSISLSLSSSSSGTAVTALQTTMARRDQVQHNIPIMVHLVSGRSNFSWTYCSLMNHTQYSHANARFRRAGCTTSQLSWVHARWAIPTSTMGEPAGRGSSANSADDRPRRCSSRLYGNMHGSLRWCPLRGFVLPLPLGSAQCEAVWMRGGQ